MSEKITKEFSFEAPIENYHFESSDKKTINSTYRGASDIWIYVDQETGLNPQFVSEGDLPDPTDTWRHRSVKLDSNNTNHILLMDLLAGSTAHQSNEVTEYFNQPGDVPLNPEYVFSYTDLENPSASDTFDVKRTRIDENNVVHYEWHQSHPGLTKNDLLELVRVHKLRTEELLRDPLISTNVSAKAMYEKFIAILDYVNDNLVDRIDPWKISIPLVHELN